jgi:hypothetical protein
LKNNLWLADENTRLLVDDSISVDLDVAMEVRRGLIGGEAVPSGILTYLQNTLLGKILDEISNKPEKEYIDVGCFLLSNSGDTNLAINKKLSEIQNRYNYDRKPHNVLTYNREIYTGIIFHINDMDGNAGKRQLVHHCMDKISELSARKWYGVHVSPREFSVISCVSLNSIGNLINQDAKVLIPKSLFSQRKPSRNDKCPCGSGKKYKKCCGVM